MPPLSQPLVTVVLVVGTAMVQLFAQYLLGRLTDALSWMPLAGRSASHKMVVTITAIVVLMAGHLCEVLIWTLRYYQWGEVGGFAASFYFSLASFTTVGANELALSAAHRMVGAIESAVGMLMFGWSTALLVEIIQRADRRAQLIDDTHTRHCTTDSDDTHVPQKVWQRSTSSA